MRSKVLCCERHCSSLSALRSFRSAPAQNALSPAPVSTVQRYRCSSRSPSKISQSSAAVRVSTALATLGRSSVASRTSPGLSSTRIAARSFIRPRYGEGLVGALLWRLGPVLADGDAAGRYLAVGRNLGAYEDRRTRNQKRLVARDEIDDGRAVRHQNGLRSAFVFEGQLVAARGLDDLRDVGVGHRVSRGAVPRGVARSRLRRKPVHLARDELAGRVLLRGRPDVGARREI